jgi:DnaJ-class molecular chaperone
MAFRNYSLALHPDKNSDALKEEAGKLFNIFSIIQENIRKELN